MKHILYTACFILAALNAAAQCPNGDAEMSAFTGWKAYTGYHTDPAGLDLSPANFVPGFVSPTRHHKVNGTGNDPIVGAPIPLVAEGGFSFKLGNSSAGSESEIMSYTFTLTPDFSFVYATVLQSMHTTSAHPDNFLPTPFFRYWISRSPVLAISTAPGNLLLNRTVVPPVGASDPYYHEWTKVCPLALAPELGAAMGEEVTIYFATGDCPYGGHYGYAYIDGLCKPNVAQARFTAPATVTSPTDPITVDGSPSLFENDHYWKMNKVTAAGADIPGTTVLAPAISLPPTLYTMNPAGLLDIRPYYTMSYPINDNDRLKVTLYVYSCMTGWTSSSKTIIINYP